MPLQNRVSPTGEFVATASRGELMGNRGGRLHDSAQRLGARRWASKSWITCRLDMPGRRRDVMGASYTELFFLDEATALAAGHRPCFECRRADAIAFAHAFAAGREEQTPAGGGGFGANGADPGSRWPLRAREIDAVLHKERIDRASGDGRGQRRWRAPLSELPFGAMALLWGAPWLLLDEFMFRWRFDGYDLVLRRPQSGADASAEVLTPPSIVRALRAGYRPNVGALFG